MAKKPFKGDPKKIAQILNDRIQDKLKQFVSNNPKQRALMIRIADRIVTTAKKNVRKQTLVDRGHLVNSIRHEFEGHVIKIGSFGVPYAAIHEFGGTITPKKRKFLTIPINDAYKNTSALDHGDLHFKSNKKTGEFFLVKGTGENQIIAYKLVKFVEIPARPYLAPAFQTHKRTIRKEMRQFIRTVYGGSA